MREFAFASDATSSLPRWPLDLMPPSGLAGTAVAAADDDSVDGGGGAERLFAGKSSSGKTEKKKSGGRWGKQRQTFEECHEGRTQVISTRDQREARKSRVLQVKRWTGCALGAASKTSALGRMPERSEGKATGATYAAEARLCGRHTENSPARLFVHARGCTT